MSEADEDLQAQGSHEEQESVESASRPSSGDDAEVEVDQAAQEQARQTKQERAKTLQASLLALVERVEGVRAEHDKLEGENKFLQSYIGDLMSTSKIISAGAAKGKGGRAK
ncbi:MAG: hypothetical protein M1838_003261 [Thelocarpon superellum]|nr:MAG: hypothetical protein M1838_003261 [Thelocarpon superellum]